MGLIQDSKKNILNYNSEELKEEIIKLGEKVYRARQIFSWLSKGVENFADMTNLSIGLRNKLEEIFYIGLPTVKIHQESIDKTVKCLLEFHDGARVESVFMKYEFGNSLCISSQVGCRMGCKFCASTIAGLERNLTAGEMYAEVLKMKNETNENISHIVIMGMGEPFDNYEELSKFIQLIHDENGFNLSLRNITVSTCGIIPNIKRFSEDFPQVNLAISLHASNGEIRNKIMPIASKYNYDDLITACKEYTERTKRRITFEYSMIDGINDSLDNALELSKQLKGWLSHVNLIPLNGVLEREYKASKKEKINEFKKVLEENGVNVTIRRTLGADISAACGQLRQR